MALPALRGETPLLYTRLNVLVFVFFFLHFLPCTLATTFIENEASLFDSFARGSAAGSVLRRSGRQQYRHRRHDPNVWAEMHLGDYTRFRLFVNNEPDVYLHKRSRHP